MDELACDEIEIFRFLLSRAKKLAKTYNTPEEEIFAPFLDCIRFPTMKGDDLVEIVEPSGTSFSFNF